ncbi:MAG: bifunctional folylpolyglutamate synthase/dihydrofolate synthase [Sulfurospirillum sp.]|nr:bifunctional folylpolyglutamate synthase/dihydrofolate synthase [Sulfurospirillum sp.]MBL0702365.1 bifunctional folylpolyglutamate synthase/dihydrofolate synthase [Sulfurospirillum sp.]
MRVEKFLQSKPLYYEKIDYDRFPNIYKKIKNNFKLPKIVHVVGTNAKGTTGRALAHMLHVNGLNVGHYSSPHITKFNERIWINGKDIDDKLLEITHKKLQILLSLEDKNILSYFEYTTLLAMLIFCQKCDYVVLEAGLGGEFDATNVFEKQLCIVTPIGFDHEAFLGSTIEKIATTKLRSVNEKLLLAKQYEKEVYKLAYERIKTIDKNLYFAQSFLDNNVYNELNTWFEDKNYPFFFKDNFTTALCAYQLLGYEVDVNLLDNLKLYGRCQKISSNVTIDVGHNPMAAVALLKHFRKKKVILVYNSLNDKKYKIILEILKPIIKEVQIFDIENKRKVLKKVLENTLSSLNIPYSTFKKITKDEEYLVFGSFSVVENYINEK